MIHVLYLDDEEHNLTAFRAAFRRDFHVHVTTVPSEAVRILQEHPIEVVISDQKMPDISGVEFFEMIMADHPDPVRMLLTRPCRHRRCHRCHQQRTDLQVHLETLERSGIEAIGGRGR